MATPPLGIVKPLQEGRKEGRKEMLAKCTLSG